MPEPVRSEEVTMLIYYFIMETSRVPHCDSFVREKLLLNICVDIAPNLTFGELRDKVVEALSDNLSREPMRYRVVLRFRDLFASNPFMRFADVVPGGDEPVLQTLQDEQAQAPMNRQVSLFLVPTDKRKKESNAMIRLRTQSEEDLGVDDVAYTRPSAQSVADNDMLFQPPSLNPRDRITEYRPLWCQPGAGAISLSSGNSYRFPTETSVEDAMLAEVMGVCHKFGGLEKREWMKGEGVFRGNMQITAREVWCMLSTARLWICKPVETSRSLTYIPLGPDTRVEQASHMPGIHAPSSLNGNVFTVFSAGEEHQFRAKSHVDMLQWVYAMDQRDTIFRPLSTKNRPAHAEPTWLSSHADEYMMDAEKAINRASADQMARDTEQLTAAASSFEGLLQSQGLRKQFEQFLSAQHSVENYVFWTHSEHFARLQRQKNAAKDPRHRRLWRHRLKLQAENIYKEFVEAGSPLEISCPHSTRTALEQRLEACALSSRVPEDLFEQLQTIALEELIKTQYVQFVFHPEYRSRLLVMSHLNFRDGYRASGQQSSSSSRWAAMRRSVILTMNNPVQPQPNPQARDEGSSHPRGTWLFSKFRRTHDSGTLAHGQPNDQGNSGKRSTASLSEASSFKDLTSTSLHEDATAPSSHRGLDIWSVVNAAAIAAAVAAQAHAQRNDPKSRSFKLPIIRIEKPKRDENDHAVVTSPTGRVNHTSFRDLVGPNEEERPKLGLGLVLDRRLTLVMVTYNEPPSVPAHKLPVGWRVTRVGNAPVKSMGELQVKLEEAKAAGDSEIDVTFHEEPFAFQFDLLRPLGFKFDSEMEVLTIDDDGQLHQHPEVKRGWALVAIDGQDGLNHEELTAILKNKQKKARQEHTRRLQTEALTAAPIPEEGAAAAPGSGAGGGSGMGPPPAPTAPNGVDASTCFIEFLPFTYEFAFSSKLPLGISWATDLKVTGIEPLSQAAQLCVQVGWTAVGITAHHSEAPDVDRIQTAPIHDKFELEAEFVRLLEQEEDFDVIVLLFDVFDPNMVVAPNDQGVPQAAVDAEAEAPAEDEHAAEDRFENSAPGSVGSAGSAVSRPIRRSSYKVGRASKMDRQQPSALAQFDPLNRPQYAVKSAFASPEDAKWQRVTFMPQEWWDTEMLFDTRLRAFNRGSAPAWCPTERIPFRRALARFSSRSLCSDPFSLPADATPDLSPELFELAESNVAEVNAFELEQSRFQRGSVFKRKKTIDRELHGLDEEGEEGVSEAEEGTAEDEGAVDEAAGTSGAEPEGMRGWSNSDTSTTGGEPIDVYHHNAAVRALEGETSDKVAKGEAAGAGGGGAGGVVGGSSSPDDSGKRSLGSGAGGGGGVGGGGADEPSTPVPGSQPPRRAASENLTSEAIKKLKAQRQSLWDLPGQVDIHGWMLCWHRDGEMPGGGRKERTGTLRGSSTNSADDASSVSNGSIDQRGTLSHDYHGSSESIKEHHMFRRYCVLLKSQQYRFNGGELFFFDAQSECTHLVRMRFVTQLEPAPSMLNAVDLHDKFGHTWRLLPEGSAEDEVHDQFARWLSHLKQITLYNGTIRVTEVRFEGYLSKRGNYNTAYRRRWFQLLTTVDGTHLLRYFKEDTREMKGVICGFTDVHQESGNNFSVVTPDRRFLLGADSEVDRTGWMNALIPLLPESRNQRSKPRILRSETMASHFVKFRKSSAVASDR